MKKIKSFSIFEEANLSVPDLSKPSNPKVTKFGPLRGDIILGKIENKEDLKLGNGDSVKVELDDSVDIVDNNGNYDPSKSNDLKISQSRLKPAFIDLKTQKKYKISDFVKTSEFSGGRGTSLGSTETTLVEDIQSYVFAFKQKYYRSKNLSSRIFLDENLDKIIQSGENAFTSTKISIDDIKKYKRYYITFIRTANKFIHTNKGILSRERMYNFHQISSGSSLMKSLISCYKRSCKNSVGSVINMAKWSPSDIWAVSVEKESSLIDQLGAIDSITNLNDFIDVQFKSKNMVGISLKKISSRTENIIIVINKETERPKFEVDHIVLSTNPYTKGLDMIINRKSFKFPGQDRLNIRSSSSGISNINVEILGSSSRHGKCSLTRINSILDSIGLESVPLVSELQIKSRKELMQLLDDTYQEIFEMDSSEISQGRGISNPSIANVISKCQALTLARILIRSKIQNPTMSDSCINSIMYYALAIENEYFESPKYARVVEY